MFDELRRIASHNCPGINWFRDHRHRSDHSTLSDGQAHSHKDTCTNPALICDFDRSSYQSHVWIRNVVGRGAKEGILRHRCMPSNGQSIDTIAVHMMCDRCFVAHSQIPRSPDFDTGGDTCISADGGTKHSQQRPSPSKANTRRPARASTVKRTAPDPSGRERLAPYKSADGPPSRTMPARWW